MNKDKWLFRPAYFAALVLYFAAGYTTLGFGEKWGDFFYPEDRYFENVGAIALFIASVISFHIFLRALKTRKITKMYWAKQLAYLGFVLLYFFGAGEEISWGQRIFHIQEPKAIAGENVQDELNIHNLAVFENSELLKADNIFSVYWLTFAVLIPAGSLAWKPFRRFAESIIPIVSWDIGLLFLINYAGAKLAEPIFASAYTFQLLPYVQAVQEIKESNYELMFIFLSLAILRDLNSQIAEKTTAPAAVDA